MKKTFFILLLSVCGFVGVHSQEGFKFGAGITGALPIGDMSDGWTFGLGAEIQGEYHFAENISGLITTGYTNFFGKDYSGYKVDNVGLIPVLAGVRFFPSSKVFIGAKAGLGIFTGSGNSETGFNYRPEIGYQGGNIQLSLNYNGWSKDGGNLSHLGLAAIFLFGGDKK